MGAHFRLYSNLNANLEMLIQIWICNCCIGRTFSEEMTKSALTLLTGVMTCFASPAVKCLPSRAACFHNLMTEVVKAGSHTQSFFPQTCAFVSWHFAQMSLVQTVFCPQCPTVRHSIFTVSIASRVKKGEWQCANTNIKISNVFIKNSRLLQLVTYSGLG